MGNNWKITDTLTKVFADEVPDGQGSIRLSTLHRETVSCVHILGRQTGDVTGRFP